ncbi:carboxypeptidase-like regulatory domain-containing protein [Aquirufa sp. ROCK-SH2]
MNNIYLCYLLLFLFGTKEIKAQNISGQVIDSKDSKPLSKASIRINNTGTLSDNKGHFNLSISAYHDLNKHKIHISYIGYQTQEISINDFKQHRIIRLEENSKDLKEVIVSSSARSLVEEAIRKIPENYTNHHYTIRGILSETNRKKRDEIMYELKALISGNIEPYQSNKKEVEVKIDALDRRSIYNLDSIQFVKWSGTAKVIEYFDYVQQRDLVLDLKKTKKYHYFLEDIVYKSGRPTYKINVSNGKKKQELMGILYIDQENLAFESLHFFKTHEDTLRSNILTNRKIRSTSAYTQYRKIDSNWYLSEIKVSKEEIYKSIPTYINVNFLATEYDSTSVLHVNYQEKFQRGELLSNLENKGSIEQWKIIKDKISANNVEYLSFTQPKQENTKSSKQEEVKLSNHSQNWPLKPPKLSVEIGLGTRMLKTSMNPMVNASLIDLPYGFVIPNDKYLETSPVPLWKFGLNVKLWKGIEAGIEYNNTIPYVGNESEFLQNVKLAYVHIFNKKHRPFSITPSVNYGNRILTKNMGQYASTQTQNERLGLDDEQLSIKLESQVKLLSLGLQVGLELNRKKYIQLGLTYHIPIQDPKETWIFKETKGFLFNSEKRITNQNPILQYPNNTYSLSLTYKFLRYAK